MEIPGLLLLEEAQGYSGQSAEAWLHLPAPGIGINVTSPIGCHTSNSVQHSQAFMKSHFLNGVTGHREGSIPFLLLPLLPGVPPKWGSSCFLPLSSCLGAHSTAPHLLA